MSCVEIRGDFFSFWKGGCLQWGGCLDVGGRRRRNRGGEGRYQVIY